MKNFGYVESKIDGTEHIFGATAKTIPEQYTFRDVLPKVLDQGSLSICVPCSSSAYINWKLNLNDGSNNDNSVALMDIYKSRSNNGEGMSFKEALHYLRHNGVKTNKGIVKINAYAMVKSFELLKYALVMNGPCLAALPVYSGKSDFWNKRSGDSLVGYHAISIVGYDKEGFIIRNSWGTSFGDKGYTKISYDDAKKFLEMWTIVD